MMCGESASTAAVPVPPCPEPLIIPCPPGRLPATEATGFPLGKTGQDGKAPPGIADILPPVPISPPDAPAVPAPGDEEAQLALATVDVPEPPPVTAAGGPAGGAVPVVAGTPPAVSPVPAPVARVLTTAPVSCGQAARGEPGDGAGERVLPVSDVTVPVRAGSVPAVRLVTVPVTVGRTLPVRLVTVPVTVGRTLPVRLVTVPVTVGRTLPVSDVTVPVRAGSCRR